MGRATQTATLAGTVKTTHIPKGFLFVAGDDGVEYFCHRSAATDFDSLKMGDRVRFLPGEGPKGPRAEQVVKA
jgi:cold shock CspA family protein